MTHATKLPAGPAVFNSLTDAITAVHENGGLEILTDELAHWSEVKAALEPVLAAVFAAASAGEAVNLEEVNGDLGLLAPQEGEFNPADRARPYLERAVEDGQAFCEIMGNVLLLSEAALRGATGRAEWAKWEAQVDDDVTAPALHWDVHGAARNIARQWLKHEPRIIPAEPALIAVLGQRAAGMPTDRSTWRYALDGARAGFEDHQEHSEAEGRRKNYFAERVQAAFAGEGK